MNNEDKIWQAIERRDRSLDGQILIGVLTTGVYCRPSCPSRRPLRKNVRFYATPEEAERDGLRPCLRCRPRDDRSDTAGRVRELCRYLEEHAEEPPDLADLAARAGLSRFHLQRSFKAAVGLTPRQYVEAFRMRRLKRSLVEAKDVTEAVYDAGFGSSSRVYERAGSLGMTPKQYRQGGQGVAISYVTVETALGLMMMGATDRGICFVQFGESADELLAELRREFPAARVESMREPHPPEFHAWMEALREHLAGTAPKVELPLDIRATAFQMRVWNYLRTIPRGHVQSYGEVAAGIGSPSAVRAVARACASNRVAVLIPCHRVIRGTGDLGGYKWGLARKRALLEMER